MCAVFESFILGHFIHSLMGYGKRSSPRKSAALDEPLRARCLMGLQQLLLGACCCPSWLPVSTPFCPALLRSMTRSCARQVVRRPVVLVGCRAGEH